MSDEKYLERLSKDIQDINSKLDLIRTNLDIIEVNSKKDFEHQLFFGLVLSFGLFFITLPSESFTRIFMGILSKDVILVHSNTIKNILVSTMLFSSLLRYYGSISNKYKYTLGSVYALLIGLFISIHIIIYNIIGIWLINTNPLYYIILSFTLLIIAKFSFPKIETRIFNYYTNNKI
jgi:hypothetical protein